MLVQLDRDLYSSMKSDSKDYRFWYKMGEFAMMEKWITERTKDMKAGRIPSL